MGWLYRRLIRPALFAQEAERVHDFTLARLAWASRHRWACNALQSFLGSSELPVELFGLRFPNPVGLAAGMDKDAKAVPAWAALGFGFTELGGVTWLAQPGNPQPRVFRAIPEQAIVNRMGFNNDGAMALTQKLQAWRDSGCWPAHPVGINLGKSKVAPLNEAAADYANSFRALQSLADFFVVNVSSPNTPNLRQLQDKAALDEIVVAMQEINRQSAIGHRQSGKPILVKVAPDLSFDALDEILDLCQKRGLAGIVATNTTITRPASSDAAVSRVYAETGGLSGRPLAARSTEVIRHLYRQSRGSIPIIGVGGIFNAADAWEKITAGASLVQVYTGLVYEGPALAKNIVSGLRRHVELEGMKNLSDAVGTKV
ncbi:MAG: quinone-dependent dihydroorotate dehydrogenase [Verrucomicrobia bacterium]|nr:MAG: quinone-dependent dihydroorotate dehydrogenase [Verrucomicrobiota bacterium]